MNEFQRSLELKKHRETWPSRKHIKEGREALVRQLDAELAGKAAPEAVVHEIKHSEKPIQQPKTAKAPSIVVTVSNGSRDFTVTLAAPTLNGTLPKSAFNDAALKQLLIKALAPHFGRLT